jgi:hypothetical protein
MRRDAVRPARPQKEMQKKCAAHGTEELSRLSCPVNGRACLLRLGGILSKPWTRP